MEEDEMDSSLPRVNEGSLPSDKKLEETQNVKVTFITVLPIRPPSPEDSRLPAPSATPTGSNDLPEAASTSQGVSGVKGPTNSCTPFLERRTNVSIALIKEIMQLMSDRVPDLLVASPDVAGGQICRSESTMKLLAEDMVAKISTILQSDADIQQAVQSKGGLKSITAEVIMTIKNIFAGKTTVHQEEKRLIGVEASRENLVPLEACRATTPELELEVDEIRQGVTSIMDESLFSRRPEIADTILYRSLCLAMPLPRSGQRGADEVKMTMIFLEPQPQTSATAEPSQESVRTDTTRGKGPLQRALRTLSRLCRPQVVPVPATTSGADLDQEPLRRPLLLRMFRAIKKSTAKTCCCFGDRDMVLE